MDGINSLLSEPGDWNSAGESRRWRTQSAVDCSLLLLLLPRNVVEALTLVEAWLRLIFQQADRALT